jgi:hypothetical protein
MLSSDPTAPPAPPPSPLHLGGAAACGRRQCTVHSAQCTVHTVQCTLRSAQCTQCALCTAQCTVYTVQVYTAQCTVYSVHCTVYTAPSCPLYTVQCTVCSVLCTLHGVQCTVCSVHCTVYSVHSTPYTVHCSLNAPVQCTLYSAHCTVYSVHCAVYSVHCTLPPHRPCTARTVQCTMYSVQGVGLARETSAIWWSLPWGLCTAPPSWAGSDEGSPNPPSLPHAMCLFCFACADTRAPPMREARGVPKPPLISPQRPLKAALREGANSLRHPGVGPFPHRGDEGTMREDEGAGRAPLGLPHRTARRGGEAAGTLRVNGEQMTGHVPVTSRSLLPSSPRVDEGATIPAFPPAPLRILAGQPAAQAWRISGWRIPLANRTPPGSSIIINQPER